MTVFDKLYMVDAAYFGGEPDDLLTRFCASLDPGARVLDVGAGQGRHALFLARRGYPVDCIEASRVAVSQISERAAKERLPVRAFPIEFDDYSPDVDSYPVILIFGLIQELAWDSIGALMSRIDEWTRPGSLVLATAFTTGDPEIPDVSRTWRRIGSNSYLSDAGYIRTYLEPAQLQTLFEGWEPLHYWEGLGPEHRHGSDPPHQHGRVEAVLRRRPTSLGSLEAPATTE